MGLPDWLCGGYTRVPRILNLSKYLAGAERPLTDRSRICSGLGFIFEKSKSLLVKIAP